MEPGSDGRATRDGLVRALSELVAALDQRVACIERAGEHQIALDAAALRAEAVERLTALEANPDDVRQPRE